MRTAWLLHFQVVCQGTFWSSMCSKSLIIPLLSIPKMSLWIESLKSQHNKRPFLQHFGDSAGGAGRISQFNIMNSSGLRHSALRWNLSAEKRSCKKKKNNENKNKQQQKHEVILQLFSPKWSHRASFLEVISFYYTLIDSKELHCALQFGYQKCCSTKLYQYCLCTNQ